MTEPYEPNEQSEPIEAYLDGLQQRLVGSPREVRRMVAEAESHLYDALAAGVRNGLSHDAATSDALARFGSEGQVEAAHEANRALSWRRFVSGLAAQFAPLVTVGLLAIGTSGVVARLMTSIRGRTWVFADAPGTRYSASACHHWMSIHPGAATCTAAYLAETTADNLQVRYGAGLLGIALAVALVILRRRGVRAAPVVPGMLLDFAGGVAFAIAGVALLALGLDQMRVADGRGAGQWFSASVVALPLAAVCLWRFAVAARTGVGTSSRRAGPAGAG